jgi:stage II sporulation protein D
MLRYDAMRFGWLVLLALAPTAAIVLLVAGCGRSEPVTLPQPPAAARTTLPETIRIRTGGRVAEVPLEVYVVGTALAEVGPVGEAPETVDRIFRVQSIIARTYAVYHLGRHRAEGFDLCDTTHCQVYDPGRIRTSRFAEAARTAAARTAGQVLMFGDRPGQALFHADCGGHTADAALVWGGAAVPYLVGGPDVVDQGTHQTWEFEIDRERLRQLLNASPLAPVGRKLEAVTIDLLDDSGRAARLAVEGSERHVLSGEQLRALINQEFGPRAIRSTRFRLTLTADGTYHFDGTGFGHGVGLCQVGAAARLRRGDEVTEVLDAYYPGMHLARLSTGGRSRRVDPGRTGGTGPRPFPGS